MSKISQRPESTVGASGGELLPHLPPGPHPGDLSETSDPLSYLRQAIARLRAGDTGVLPVVGGLVVLAIIFQSLNGNFLTPGNLVNLMVQGSVYMLFALGMVFVLLIGEIDLSIGYVGGVSGVVVAELVFGNNGVSWWLALGGGLLTGALIGMLNGLIITVIGLPSFIVTLAGLLAWNGVMLIILGNGGTVPINNDAINNLANGLLSPMAGWIVMAVIVALFVVDLLIIDRRKRRSLNMAPPTALLFMKIAGVILAGVIVVLICNVNRGRFVPIRGVPWVVLIVIGFATLWTIVLTRTAFGTHIYAIGGNAEATRRAGVSVNRIRVCVFMIAGFMGSVAGSHLCIAFEVGVDESGWWHAGPLLHRLLGHWRDKSFRWSRQGGLGSTLEGWSSLRLTMAWVCSAFQPLPATS